MTDKQIIIEDCPHFIGGCCQEYLDGACENHKCDLKIIRELEQQLKAKEQECEELKKIINEAKNSKLDLKSFLVGEAVQNEYEQQLDQLKAENEELKGIRDGNFLHALEEQKRADKLSKTLTEIKEIAEALDCKNPEKCWVNDISITGDCWGCEPDKYEEPRDLADCPSHLAHIILQKISEVEDGKITS